MQYMLFVKAVPTLNESGNSPKGHQSVHPQEKSPQTNSKKGDKKGDNKDKSAKRKGKKKAGKKIKEGLNRLPSHAPHYGIANMATGDKKKKKKK